jgi:protein-disulfide isomerase
VRENWFRIRPWLGTVIRLALGAIWIWAAVDKLGNPRTFVQAVRAYDATPEWLSKGIGYGLPVFEFCLGVLLVLGIAVRAAAIFSVLLFLVFLIGLAQAAARGIQLECGCFGGGGTTDAGTQYTLDILRDIGLLILAAYLVIWSFTRLGLEDYLGRHDQVAQPSAKRMRSEQGRRKYNAMLEERRKAARERGLWLNGSLAVVIVVIGLIGVGVQANRAKIAGSLTATHATVSSGVVFGKKAAATVDVYEDFQCPNCLNFEKAVQNSLDTDVRANKAQVRFHMIAILDSSSNNRYSTRSANAALCASDISVDQFVAYHNKLFAEQPPESGSGRTDKQLEAYASSIGITGAKLTTFDSCVQSQQHKALVEALTERASQRGVNATPTIIVNGKSINHDLASWNKAITAALKKGPAPSPSKTPSPSAAASSSASSAASKTPSRSASSSKKP